MKAIAEIVFLLFGIHKDKSDLSMKTMQIFMFFLSEMFVTIWLYLPLTFTNWGAETVHNFPKNQREMYHDYSTSEAARKHKKEVQLLTNA